MAVRVKRVSSKITQRRTIEVANKYAIYLANQESLEIDNALLTLKTIKIFSQQKATPQKGYCLDECFKK